MVCNAVIVDLIPYLYNLRFDPMLGSQYILENVLWSDESKINDKSHKHK